MRPRASWPTAWHGHQLRDVLVALGYDVDVPWKDLPKKDRDWILFTEEQPVVEVRLHSAGDASRLTALLLPQIFPIFSVVAPCQPGASPVSVRRWTFTTGC